MTAIPELLSRLRDTYQQLVSMPLTCGKHSTAVPRHTETSAGVVRNIIRDLTCLPKGWLP
jgi:hypothetical protein